MDLISAILSCSFLPYTPLCRRTVLTGYETRFQVDIKFEVL